MRKGAVAFLAGALVVLGASPSEAAKLRTPKFTQAQIVRAAQRAIASGARPQKLRAARPAWFTRKLARKVHRRGVAAAPVDAPLPGEVGIRPGSMMVSPFICTMNYIFQKSGVTAIGTAGHCVNSTKPVLLTLSPTGGNPVLVELGKVLHKQNAGIGRDYALVQVPTSRLPWVFPTIADIGGACGIYTSNTPQPVMHYGHGLVVGTGGTPRAGMGVSLAGPPPFLNVKGVDWDWDSDSVMWAGLINGGDSGSPVRIGQLPALSNLTHGIGITGLEPSALAWGTRVTTVTANGWRLVNSPLCI